MKFQGGGGARILGGDEFYHTLLRYARRLETSFEQVLGKHEVQRDHLPSFLSETRAQILLDEYHCSSLRSVSYFMQL